MRIGIPPEGMKRVNVEFYPPPKKAMATDRTWTGDYLIVKDGMARRVIVAEIADHNAYAAENAEAGAYFQYYPRMLGA